MAKKKKKNVSPKVETAKVQEEKTTPKFEIGQKGDEFDINYSRAVRNASADADDLLTDLSQEQGADRYNFIGFAIPILVLLFFAISFILINRSDFSEVFTVKLSAETVMDGSYLENLTEAYNTTLPFGDGLADMGELLGFAPATGEEEPVEEPDVEVEEPVEVEDPVEVEESAVTEASVTTVTTTTEPITTATTEATEEEIPDTYTMYANGTVNIRLEPSSDAMMLGYFTTNSKVDVIEIRDDGWAEIYYSGIRAYVEADELSDTRIVVTTTTEATTEATTTTEETEATTTTPEETEATTTTEATTEATTTTTRLTIGYTGTYTTPNVTTTSPTTAESPSTATTTTTTQTEATTPATTTTTQASASPEDGAAE